jgi:hypothetical protein
MGSGNWIELNLKTAGTWTQAGGLLAIAAAANG